MKKTVFTLLLAFLTTVAFAQESQTAYNFLRLPISAHAAALGGDNITIIEDDPTLMSANPALLSSVSDKSINLNFMTYMAGAKTASASFTRVIKEKASVAVMAQYMDYGTMMRSDACRDAHAGTELYGGKWLYDRNAGVLIDAPAEGI